MAQQKQQHPGHSIPIPAGRFVAGSLTTIQTKDGQGRERQNPGYWFGLAVAKTQPGVDQALAQIYAMREDYRSHAATYAAAGQWLAGAFKWKVFDGDTHASWKGREGAAGCWIFGLGQTFPIKCVSAQTGQAHDANAIGLGDYVDVDCTGRINGLTDGNAGIYLNPDMVRFIQTGPRIVLGKTYEQAFGNRPVQLPVNALPVTGPAAAPAGAPALPPPGAPPAGGPGFATGVTPPPVPTPPPAGAPAVPAGAPPAPPAALPAPGAIPGAPPAPATVSPSNPPAVPPQPGFSAGPAAPPAPAPAVAVPAPCYAKQVADHYGVPHTPGYRYVPADGAGGGNTWVVDPTSV